MISSASLSLDLILDERARELYWEGFRRSEFDSCYDKFTEGTYPLARKGGVKKWHRCFCAFTLISYCLQQK
jgi:hypothetical protein